MRYTRSARAAKIADRAESWADGALSRGPVSRTVARFTYFACNLADGLSLRDSLREFFRPGF